MRFDTYKAANDYYEDQGGVREFYKSNPGISIQMVSTSVYVGLPEEIKKEMAEAAEKKQEDIADPPVEVPDASRESDLSNSEDPVRVEINPEEHDYQRAYLNSNNTIISWASSIEHSGGIVAPKVVESEVGLSQNGFCVKSDSELYVGSTSPSSREMSESDDEVSSDPDSPVTSIKPSSSAEVSDSDDGVPSGRVSLFNSATSESDDGAPSVRVSPSSCMNVLLSSSMRASLSNSGTSSRRDSLSNRVRNSLSSSVDSSGRASSPNVIAAPGHYGLSPIDSQAVPGENASVSEFSKALSELPLCRVM